MLEMILFDNRTTKKAKETCRLMSRVKTKDMARVLFRLMTRAKSREITRMLFMAMDMVKSKEITRTTATQAEQQREASNPVS